MFITSLLRVYYALITRLLEVIKICLGNSNKILISF